MPLTDHHAPVHLDESLVVSEHGPFRLTAMGAIATRSPSFEEWERACLWCHAVERASLFWIADLLAFGEDTWADKYHQAVTATGYALETLQNLVYVARNVHLSRRRGDLSFGHHQVVAPLSPAEQTEWLARAAIEGLSVMALRRAIQEPKVEPVVVAPRTAVVVPGPTTAVEIRAPFVHVEPEPVTPVAARFNLAAALERLDDAITSIVSAWPNDVSLRPLIDELRQAAERLEARSEKRVS